MRQVIYTSTAAGLCTTESLGDLLIQSRARNLSRHITGMLLYDYGHYLQILEGEDDDVAAVFGSILNDRRHKEIVTLSHVAIEAREFGYWSMAFWDLSPVARKSETSSMMDFIGSALNAKRYLLEFQGHL